MKKIIVSIITMIIFSGVVIAQENWSNKFYFRYAISTPTNDYYENGIWGSEFAYKEGGAIEMGSLVYFKGLNLGKKSKIGMDITYLSASKHKMGFDIENIDIDVDTDVIDWSISLAFPHTTFYNIGSKLGLVYTYNVWERLYIDAVAKVNPVWVNAAIRDYRNDNPLTYYTGFMGLKYSFGMNLRYDFIVLGAELNLGKLKYQSTIDKKEYIGNTLFTIDPETSEITPPEFEETNSPCFNFSIGFCF